MRYVIERRWPKTLRRRRQVIGVVAVAGAGLLGVSLSSPAGSSRFYVLTLSTAATWMLGGLLSAPRNADTHDDPGCDHTGSIRAAVPAALLGAGAFGVFYGFALVARRIPVLERAIAGVLAYSHHGRDASVLATTACNGVGEEVFFRGAVYSAAGSAHPVAVSTTVYALVTTATGNPALVLASAAMGSLFGIQRRATGDLRAPLVTHLVWSALMLRYLPPLFTKRPVA